jgi:hypothetical protein
MDKPLSVKINGLKDRLDLLIDKTLYDDALLLICQEVNQLVISKNLRGKGLYLPEVDSYITKIIDRVKTFNIEYKSNDSFSDKTIIMATELYESGGHTGIIESIIKTDPSKFIICLTDLFFQMSIWRLWNSIKNSAKFFLCYLGASWYSFRKN